MITCPLCQHANHDLATICVSCKCFLQQKVDNLNLFEMLWRVIESPRRAFRIVGLAQHKNYAIVLASVSGIGFVFTFFWFLNIGDIITDLPGLMAYGFSLGIVAGPILVLIFVIIVKLVTLFGRAKVHFKNIFAVSSYALLPVVLTVVSILPIELLTFGVFMFSKNPSGFVLKPFSYVVIVGLDAVCGIWTLILFVIGMKVLLDSNWKKALLISGVSLLLFLGLVAKAAVVLGSKLPLPV